MSLQSRSAYTRCISWLIACSTILLLGCGGGGGAGSSTPSGTTPQTLNVTIQWEANKELRVNQTGGGYRVYISQTNGFDIGGADVLTLNIPWVSGTQTPVSTVQPLVSGNYYVRVAAYTSFPVSNTASNPSAQIQISVPFTTP